MKKDIEAILNESKISRRDAMKVFGLGGAGLMMASSTEVEAVVSSNKAKGKIVIVGGGLTGVSTAALLMKSIVNADVTIIEPNPKSVSYQPGQTLVASGVWQPEDISYNTADFMPDGVKWIHEKAIEFNPSANMLKTSGGQTIKYDYLIVAAGLVLDFGAIRGLEAIGDVYSLDANDATRAKKILGKNGLCSVYFSEGAKDTWGQMQEFVAAAKSGKKVKALFPEPHTPFKCGGVQKKMVNLTNARLVEAGARANAEMAFVTNSKKLFGVPVYAEAIKGQMKDRNVSTTFEHKLVAIDVANKIATFEKHWEEKGILGPLLVESEIVEKIEVVKMPYDFCHLIPPQKAPKEIAMSPLGSEKGLVPVNKETLQHIKFPNVFALGDIVAVPLGKTGGSARKQYKVLVENLVAYMERKEELPSKYDGYTVCPLITNIGEVMLAEFKWDPKDDEKAVVAPSFPQDPTKPTWFYWFLKAYLLKPMTMYGMLSGRA